MARLMSSTELFQRLHDDQSVVVVDVHTPDEFQKEHIPGAINIPLNVLPEVARVQLGKNQRIIVYGQTHEDGQSNKAAEILEAMGFRKVSDFDGGLAAWKRAGYQTSSPALAKQA